MCQTANKSYECVTPSPVVPPFHMSLLRQAPITDGCEALMRSNWQGKPVLGDKSAPLPLHPHVIIPSDQTQTTTVGKRRLLPTFWLATGVLRPRKRHVDTAECISNIGTQILSYYFNIRTLFHLKPLSSHFPFACLP